MHLYLFSLLLLFYSSLIRAGIYTDVDIFAYSEPVSVNGAINEMKGDFSGGTVALTHNSIEIGITQGRVQYGIIHRYDYEMEFTNDTAKLAYQDKNKLPFDIGRNYQLDLNIRNSYSRGAHVRYSKHYNQQISFIVGISFLQGIKLTEGWALGHATAQSESNYDIEFDINYYYSKDHVFKRDVVAPRGYGLSSDIQVNYQHNPNFSIELKIKDLLGRILWIDAPKTIAHANNDNATVDEDGRIRFEPTYSGRHSTPNYVQKLQPMVTLNSDYKLDRITSLTAMIYHTQAITFLDLGANFTLSNSKQLHISYMPVLEAITLGTKMKNFYFSVTSDRLELHQSHTLGCIFGFSTPL